jgi:hypothetical protein
MWPKIFMQLLDVLPRLGHLVPTVERLLIGGGTAAAVEGISEVREDLANIGKDHEGLLRQLHDQTVQIAAVEEEVQRLRLAVEHSERRMLEVESSVARVNAWVKASVALGIITLVMVAALLIHLLAH